MTDLSGPDDSPTLPNLYNRPPVPGPPPPGFWDELRPGPPPGSQPGWYGSGGSTVYPPEYEETPGIVIRSSGPDKGARRRGALMAVAGVVLATVIVVLATVVIGPHLGSGDGPTNNVAPPVTPTGSSELASESSASTASSTSPVSGSSSASSTKAATTRPSSPKASASSPKPSVVTTTTKAATTTKNVGPAGVTTKTVGSGSATSSSTTSSRPSVVTTVIEPTTTKQQPPPPPPPTTTTSSQLDFGVPTREIQCTNGLIVQLASELTPQAFQARVQSLRGQGLVPGDAAAATSGGSCAIFANQSNTYVLYSGPFGDLRDACNSRLSGPYDAYIKGGNPSSAGSFFSCICPSRAKRLPTITSVGQSDQWIGELQRMLGAHLRYSVGGLDNSSWGVYTNGTKSAVQRFQSDHHLPPNGVVDSKTWAAIQSAGC